MYYNEFTSDVRKGVPVLRVYGTPIGDIILPDTYNTREALSLVSEGCPTNDSLLLFDQNVVDHYRSYLNGKLLTLPDDQLTKLIAFYILYVKDIQVQSSDFDYEFDARALTNLAPHIRHDVHKESVMNVYQALREGVAYYAIS